MDEYIKWVDYNNGSPIPSKIVGGTEEGRTIYIARLKQRDASFNPGKFVINRYSEHVGICYAGIDGREINSLSFQVLTGDESKFKWVAQSGPFNLSNVLRSHAIPVQGGVETDGSPLYIARAPVRYRGKDIGSVCGKVSEGKAAQASFGDIQHTSTEYEVLAFIEPSPPPTKDPAPPVTEAPANPPSIPNLPFIDVDALLKQAKDSHDSITDSLGKH